MVEDVQAYACGQGLFRAEADEALALASANDCRAFAELYGRYYEPVYRYMRYQAPSQEARDLTAQVFFRAYRSCHQFRGEASFRAWLFRIAHNTVVSWRRSRERVPVPVPEVPDRPDGAGDGSHRAEAAEERERLWAVVAELRPLERELIELRYVEDLAPREIAAALGQSPGAVRVRLHRLLRRLRKRLEEGGDR